jgi:hypothetical protein
VFLRSHLPAMGADMELAGWRYAFRDSTWREHILGSLHHVLSSQWLHCRIGIDQTRPGD